MKGNISLSKFIAEVKKELRESIDNEDPFFIMKDVELEVKFSLSAAGGGEVDFLVAKVGGEAQAEQTHSVRLTLTPFVNKPDHPADYDRSGQHTTGGIFPFQKKAPKNSATSVTRPMAQKEEMYGSADPKERVALKRAKAKEKVAKKKSAAKSAPKPKAKPKKAKVKPKTTDANKI